MFLSSFFNLRLFFIVSFLWDVMAGEYICGTYMQFSFYGALMKALLMSSEKPQSENFAVIGQYLLWLSVALQQTLSIFDKIWWSCVSGITLSVSRATVDLLSAQLSFLCSWIIFLNISVFLIVLFLVSPISSHKSWFFFFSSSISFYKLLLSNSMLSIFSAFLVCKMEFYCARSRAVLALLSTSFSIFRNSWWISFAHFLLLAIFHLTSWNFLAIVFWGHQVWLERCYLHFLCFCLLLSIDQLK